MPDEPSDRRSYDWLLDRYVAVWLWSILFGTATGLLYTFTDLRWRDWGMLTLALAVPGVFGFALAFLAWSHLLRALRHYLIPTYVLHQNSDASRYTYELSRAIGFIINAALLRLVLGLVDIALSAFGRR